MTFFLGFFFSSQGPISEAHLTILGFLQWSLPAFVVTRLHCLHTVLSSPHPDIPYSSLLAPSETPAVIQLVSQMTFHVLRDGHQPLPFQVFYICSKAKVAFTIISFQETSDSFQETSDSFHPHDMLISARTLEYSGHPSSLQQSDRVSLPAQCNW